MIGEVPDVTSAVIASLTEEGYRVKQLVAGSTTRPSPGERYETDLSSPDSLRQLHRLLCPAEGERIGGVLSFLGMTSSCRAARLEDREMPMTVAAWTFQIVKEFVDDLQPNAARESGWFINVTALDGMFGLGQGDIHSVAAAGTLGIVKTLHRESPRLRVKNIDVEPNMPADLLVTRLLQELTAKDDLLEVGLTRQGRWRLSLTEEPILRDPPPLAIDRDAVILVTGGGYGVTAAVALQIAIECKPRLILVGRSPLPTPETPHTRGLDRAAVRKLFVEEARSRDESVVPAEIERRVSRLFKEREMRANLDACTAAGSIVEYHALDVRDSETFGQLIDNLYERFGRIDGVIHGAGIIADRRIRDKSLDSFTDVFRTKVDGALTLADKLRAESLRFLLFFGSLSGRFGNAGQVDYSAANEMLNKLANVLHRRWPGRVACLNWGPWEGGMVSDELRRLYASAGIELITVNEGVAACIAEIGRKDRRTAEVILARNVKRMLPG